MALIRLPMKREKPRRRTDRRPPGQVLDAHDAPSARGNSFYKRVRLCPREHALAVEAGLRRPGDNEALTAGFTVHHALEAYYRAIQTWQRSIELNDEGMKNKLKVRMERVSSHNHEYLWGGIPSAEQAAWKAIEPMRTEPGYAETYEEVERMVAHYLDHYRRQDRWRVIAIEETLEYEDRGVFPSPASSSPSIPPLEYSARLDLIVEDLKRGGMWIVEHKTTKVVTADLIAGYQLDQQILGQVWLMHNCVDLSAYPPLRGVLVNLVTKHMTPKFERVEVLPSRYHLAAFEESMRAWNSLLPIYERLGWPKALGNCAGPARYWRRCEFFEVCHGQPELTVVDAVKQEPPFGFVRAEDWSE